MPRKEVLQIRISEAEKFRWKLLAESVGMSVAAWVRYCCNKEIPGDEEKIKTQKDQTRPIHERTTHNTGEPGDSRTSIPKDSSIKEGGRAIGQITKAPSKSESLRLLRERNAS